MYHSFVWLYFWEAVFFFVPLVYSFKVFSKQRLNPDPPELRQGDIPERIF